MALLRQHKVEFNTLTVISNRTFHRGKEIYQFLTKNGSDYLQFQPCIDHELDRRSDYDWSLNGEQWGRFLCDVFDEWCDGDIGQVNVQFFENCLAILMDYPSQMCHHAPTCGQQLMAEADGEVFSCDHYGYEQYSLGQCKELRKTIIARYGKWSTAQSSANLVRANGKACADSVRSAIFCPSVMEDALKIEPC
ncbi:arylsulfatase regulator [Vibrio maritimus]|uniref:Arylsulfatase regulator n=1 Tax=Vibrio maritimus TaxID=990268 RepID=A0A090SB55_9VIBR|nr:arylsulfatase regulator [Vibrio maritimus]